MGILLSNVVNCIYLLVTGVSGILLFIMPRGHNAHPCQGQDLVRLGRTLQRTIIEVPFRTLPLLNRGSRLHGESLNLSEVETKNQKMFKNEQQRSARLSLSLPRRLKMYQISVVEHAFRASRSENETDLRLKWKLGKAFH